MAKLALRNKAIEMRKRGMSYTQIKNEIGVSKSTLSNWLHDHPLSEERIRELRDKNEQRIELCRQTKLLKRQTRCAEVGRMVAREIGSLSDREFYLSGLLLYWAEGTKAARGLVQLTNTDPSMLKFFIQWLEHSGICRTKLKVKLHLYSDMDEAEATTYWIKALDIGQSQFAKPYIKSSSKEKRRNYKGRFGMGTCSITVHDISLYERMMAGIAHLGGGAVRAAV